MRGALWWRNRDPRHLEVAAAAWLIALAETLVLAWPGPTLIRGLPDHFDPWSILYGTLLWGLFVISGATLAGILLGPYPLGLRVDFWWNRKMGGWVTTSGLWLVVVVLPMASTWSWYVTTAIVEVQEIWNWSKGQFLINVTVNRIRV